MFTYGGRHDMHARADLISPCKRLDVVEYHHQQFGDAKASLNSACAVMDSTWATDEWDKERFECIELITLSIKLVAKSAKVDIRTFLLFCFIGSQGC